MSSEVNKYLNEYSHISSVVQNRTMIVLCHILESLIEICSCKKLIIDEYVGAGAVHTHRRSTRGEMKTGIESATNSMDGKGQWRRTFFVRSVILNN